jgi:hypothetical protein
MNVASVTHSAEELSELAVSPIADNAKVDKMLRVVRVWNGDGKEIGRHARLN